MGYCAPEGKLGSRHANMRLFSRNWCLCHIKANSFSHEDDPLPEHHQVPRPYTAMILPEIPRVALPPSPGATHLKKQQDGPDKDNGRGAQAWTAQAVAMAEEKLDEARLINLHGEELDLQRSWTILKGK